MRDLSQERVRIYRKRQLHSKKTSRSRCKDRDAIGLYERSITELISNIQNTVF